MRWGEYLIRDIFQKSALMGIDSSEKTMISPVIREYNRDMIRKEKLFY